MLRISIWSGGVALGLAFASPSWAQETLAGRIAIEDDQGLQRVELQGNTVTPQVSAAIQLTSSSSLLHTANAQRQQLIQSLQALQDSYCRAAKLDEALAVRNMIQQLQGQVEQSSQLPEPETFHAATATQKPASPDPLENVRIQNHSIGSVVYLRVTGNPQGAVWGGADGVYTSDSFAAMAAMHGGFLKEG